MIGPCIYGVARVHNVKEKRAGMYSILLLCISTCTECRVSHPWRYLLSVEAIRALRYNSKYAAKLEAKRLREAAKMAATPKIPTVNPFSARPFMLYWTSLSH